MIKLHSQSTALVLIDLQVGIIGNELSPVSGIELVRRGRALAERFRAAGASVVLVNVAFSTDGGDVLRQVVDQPPPIPAGGFPPDWSTLAPGLGHPGDILVTKRQWGAFHGTELDLQLRRRGIRTLALGGVATQIGVESTARQAYEHGYELLIVKDAVTSTSSEGHDMSMKHIMPRLGRLVLAEDIALGV